MPRGRAHSGRDQKGEWGGFGSLTQACRVGSVGRLLMLLHQFAAMLKLVVNFLQRLFQVAPLLLKRTAVFFQYVDVVLKLGRSIAGRSIVHVDEVENFGELKAHAFAAKGELQPGSVVRVVHPVAAFTAGAHDTLVFVEAYRTRCNAEFA